MHMSLSLQFGLDAWSLDTLLSCGKGAGQTILGGQVADFSILFCSDMLEGPEAKGEI